MSPSSHARPSVDSRTDSRADSSVDPARDTLGARAVAPSGSMPPEVEIDPTPALASDVLALFRGPFAEVRFPDVDRASLEEDALALLRAQAELEALDRAIEDARQEVKRRSEHLLGSTGRALAYAKVFALGQPALAEAVARVRSTPVEGGPKARVPKKKRAARENTGVQLPISAPSELIESALEPDDGELAAE